MSSSIVGTLPVTHAVDPSGSLTLHVPLQLPQSPYKPDLALAYHSAAKDQSLLCQGWTLLGVSAIERVPATMAQDGFNGSVNYDENDRFALDGQRLVKIGGVAGNEYRFEVEQWSRIYAHGDPANPTHWDQYLPDGAIRRFGNSSDSNIKALTGRHNPPTRVWAMSVSDDAFSNYATFRYINDDDSTGGYRVTEISYGGNASDKIILHRCKVAFKYDDRTDPTTVYFGGHKIMHDKRMKAITTSYTIRTEDGMREHDMLSYELKYAEAPVTKLNYLTSIQLKDMINSASLDPLTFEWTGSSPGKVLEQNKETAKITDIPAGTIGQIIPLDVNGRGCSDLVVAWQKEGILALNVYLADIEGSISSTPAPGSGPTGLSFSEHSSIFPLDLSGDGLTDILHIRADEANHTYYLTALLSKPDRTKPSVRFEKQTEVMFRPPVMGGRFETGDFSGDGRVGLVYLFEENDDEGRLRIKFVQFTSDGTKMVESDVKVGPTTWGGAVDTMRVIVGDLDGNGANDLFLLYPKLSGKAWDIAYIESRQGSLQYRGDNPLAEAVDQVTFVKDATILPYNADNDSKVGLLFVSKNNNGKLQFQLLRSTGKTLLADSSPTVTGVDYGGSVTITRLSSSSALDVVNVAYTDNGPRLHVLRFDSNTFSEIPSTTQPSGISKETIVRWADIRGIGRSDCILNTVDATSGHITVNTMFCSGPTLSSTQWQPLDCIKTFSQTLGYLYQTTYAPLTDPTVYQSNDRILQSLVNSLAENAASSAVLTGSGDGAQTMCSERAQLVTFPRFIVQEISIRIKNTPIDTLGYTYKNARVDFSGRGWLGFETISKRMIATGIQQVTSYYQKFPLIGMVSQLETKVVSTGQTLQLFDYGWVTVKENDGKNDRIQLVGLREAYYENGVFAYEVGVEFGYDDWGSTTKTIITSSQNPAKRLKIESTFEEPTESPSVGSRWVVGNKLTEDTIQETVTEDGTIEGSITLAQIKNEYLSGTNQRTKTSNWVQGSTWLDTTCEYDKVGNLAYTNGPEKRQRFKYDSTLSNLSMTITYASDTVFFIETSSYSEVLNLALGLPSSIMNSNFLHNGFKYDVLGREIEKSQGTGDDDPSEIKMTPIEKVSFSVEQGRLVETREVSNGLENQAWRQKVTTFDEAGRPLLIKESRPDDLSKFICRDIGYDNAGRVTTRSQPYLEGQESQKIKYSYDIRSRPVKMEYPPAKEGDPSLTRTLTYTYSDTDNCAVVLDNVSDGTTSRNVTRNIAFLPNPDTPSNGNFVKPCVLKQHSELTQVIITEFDGLIRPTSIMDQNGVKLSLSYDGLSREIQRRISTGDGEKEKSISHFTVTFNDKQRQATRRNELTGSTVDSTTDHYGRIIKKVTAEETVDFTYDNQLLTKVTSITPSKVSKYEKALNYDEFGNLSASTLTIDGEKYETFFTWTPMGQLLTTTNPNESSVTSTLLPDGVTPEKLTLENSSNETKLLATFSNFDNAFSRPSTTVLGDGTNALTSKYTFRSDGMFTNNTVANTSEDVLRQTWNYDAFKQVSQYSLTGDIHKYTYDLASKSARQIKKVEGRKKENFSYDSSGNISQYNQLSFINDGWKLIRARNPDNTTAYFFEYSSDGNRTSKRNGQGDTIDTMTYDSEGRLVGLNDTTFLYDATGDMIKATTIEDDKTITTIYVSDGYEVDIARDKDGTILGSVSTSYLTHEHRLGSWLHSTSDDLDSVHYYHHDHLGSVVGASTADGVMVTYYDYDAFGKVKITGPDVSRYKYSGKQMFNSIYYFGARFYDPDTGRFLTLDNYPLDLENVSPASFNMYAFSRNNPINYLDPDGNDSIHWSTWVGLGLLVGGLVLLCLIPGAGLVGAGATAAYYLGNAALGAGFSALTTEYDSDNPGSWWLQVGLGAVFGAAGGVLGKGVGMGAKALFTATTTQRTLLRVGGHRLTTTFAKRIAAKTVGEALVGGALGGVQQLTTNAIDVWTGKEKSGNLLNGVWDSVSLGFRGGAVLSVAVRGKSSQ
ncbi:hypothetical protein AMATHDRAFT_152955 [Amanita thiersii Skay4041]|uniref:Insecticide toxin TcdB middle/N-terminal domain-containing protein n=1 Tax=Amanita thiersii Skay4041 TaxID=703135 RepID=A0A2A9NHB0_9AGAR|nr:hypothetical protein AMATHDRAFT_152955 [Amanita thiersii Skay4041]